MRRDTRITRMFETNQQWKDRRCSDKRLSFERKVVKKLLDSCGIDKLQLRVMEHEWANEDNAGFYLTFGWLLSEFPDFPFLLTISEESWVPRALEIFNSSSKSCKLWNLWRESKKSFRKDIRESRQLAIAVPCSQESGLSPALIIHNGILPDGPFEESVPNQVRVRLVEPRTGEMVFIQHVNYFSAQVGIRWQAM